MEHKQQRDDLAGRKTRLRPAWCRPAGAQQRRLPVRHKRLAEIIDLAKNLDDPTSSPPSLSDGGLPQKTFQVQSLNRAKTPYPGYEASLVTAPNLFLIPEY